MIFSRPCTSWRSSKQSRARGDTLATAREHARLDVAMAAATEAYAELGDAAAAVVGHSHPTIRGGIADLSLRGQPPNQVEGPTAPLKVRSVRWPNRRK